jgi:GT2 family glycosyltransferase
MAKVPKMREDFQVIAVILNWNGGEITLSAASSVSGQVDEVVIVDNASRTRERESLRSWCKQEDVTLIENERNLGYAAGNNVGIDYALSRGADGVLIMNNDALAEPGATVALIERLHSCPGLGAVAPMVVEMERPDIVVHTTCHLRTEKGRGGWHDRGRQRSAIETEPLPTEAISGEAFLARSETLRQVGAFDERFVFYFEDTEWSARAQRGNWKLEVVPRAIFRHAIGGSMPSLKGQYFRARNRPIFLRVGLAESRLAAARHSALATFIAMAALARRGHPWIALRSVLYGWIIGILARDFPRQNTGETTATG